MNEVVMVTVDCPWCEAPVALASAESFRCDGCSVEVAIDSAPVVASTSVMEVALAA
jgi:hypothetical protein